ncbi:MULTISPECIES: HAD family hydrolase [unclassified Marinobacter]|uniref:HAD family hydrolase n=1 Tax=unclassified Marinobacter TaxID=83889 RepID=UPI0026E1286D|nr:MULTISPECIES: HAD hydrolase-like protein [unclassified Marinobacter]MDO6443879.1 HAD hydrolase-like protein [Marinobacter sp. 2_MG-2023]MDO6825232.1 HAD hydrolase-like protein [Marinobacter sp. 1_MG-2023]
MAFPNKYKTWVFDCDGVLLDSNKVKTQAFYQVAKPYGEAKADALVSYHVNNGGISRYVKFNMFLTDIIGRSTVDQEELQRLLNGYAAYVRDGLRSCEVTKGLDELRKLTLGANWLVVSGGDEQELREVFDDRQLSHYFEGNIFGSPDTKDEILAREIGSGLIRHPAVFVGDSEYDYVAASRANLDFIFVRRWSESGYAFSEASMAVDGLDSLVQLAQ